ncbi:MAG: helix-turn-helix domain-containing protein [Desulfurococcales archaeon]|nr:helix-turn-helix domain-containing protein [Desulfurococcales archaeon]
MAGGRTRRILVSIEPERLAETLLRLYRGHLTLDQLARHLGTNTRSAGRVAAALERLGMLERHSRRAFRVVSLEPSGARRHKRPYGGP